MKKLIYILEMISLCIIGSLTTSCQNNSLTKITIAEVTHSLFYAPQYIAINNGYFEEVGIDIDLITTPGADKTMAALLSKEAQIALMGPEASVYVYKGGEKNYAINFAQLTHKDGSFLLAREKNDNFQWTDLKGKTIIGGRKGGMPEMTLEYVLKKAGLTIGQNDEKAEVNIRTDVSFDVMAGVFTAGQSDYVTLFEPSASQVVLNGIGHIVASIGASSGEVPYTCYSVTKKYMENNEDILKKFTTAIGKGIDYLLTSSKEDIIKALKPSFTSSSDEEISNVINNYLSIDVWSRDLSLNNDSYNRLIEIIKMAGELEGEAAPFDKIVNNSFIV